MRLFSLLALLMVPVLLVSVSHGDSKWRALDLPPAGVDSFLGWDDEETDANGFPLALFDPFGMVLSGEAFHVCFSAYAFGDTIAFELIQEELTRVVDQLSTTTHFSLNGYHCYSVVWQAQAQLATPEMKANALAWIENMNTMGIQHVTEAAIETIERANALELGGQRIVMVANGIPNDSCYLSNAISTHNVNEYPIDVIYVNGGSAGAAYWQGVATQFGGQFLNVE